MNRPSCLFGFATLLLVVVSETALAQWNGEISAWGYNNHGQCDVPSPNYSFVEIAGGYWHSLGLQEDGSIVAWGIDDESFYDFGQVTGTPTETGFVSIAAGGWHSIGLQEDGSIVAWGRNESGQCDIPSPNIDFVVVVSGLYHNLALKEDGTIVAWGIDDGTTWDYGQVTDTPTEDGFIAVSAGGWHSLGLKEDGSIVAWGRSEYGLCEVPEPNSGFIAVASGRYHSLGLKESGHIVAWGIDDGTTWDYGQVTDTPSEDGFIAVSAGGWHSLALKEDGPISAWGRNDYGHCDVPEPNSNFVAVSGGGHHSLGLREIFTSADEEEQVAFDPNALLIHSVSPNPFDSYVTVNFQSPGFSELTLEIFDTCGRLVRIQPLGNSSAGQLSLTWNGRDSHGQKVATGVYFIRLQSGSQEDSALVVLVR